MSLPAVMVNIEAYKPLQFRHQWLMMTLASFSDRQGRCWPSLRTIADKAGRSLAWVSENLKEMQALGYFKRSRKAGAYFYELALRFLPWLKQESAGADSSKAGGQLRDNSINSQVCAQPGVRRGEPKENPRSKIQDFKNLGGDLGREAPSEAEKAEVSQLLDETLHRRPLAARMADEAAYAAAVAREKRDRWLRGIGAWIGQRFKGQAALEAWEAVDLAQKAGSRSATPTPIRRVLDRLDTLYRQEVSERRAAQAAAKVQARAVSKSHLRRKWGHYQ